MIYYKIATYSYLLEKYESVNRDTARDEIVAICCVVKRFKATRLPCLGRNQKKKYSLIVNAIDKKMCSFYFNNSNTYITEWPIYCEISMSNLGVSLLIKPQKLQNVLTASDQWCKSKISRVRYDGKAAYYFNQKWPWTCGNLLYSAFMM